MPSSIRRVGVGTVSRARIPWEGGHPVAKYARTSHHDDALHTENCIAKLKLTESLMAVKLLPQEFES